MERNLLQNRRTNPRANPAGLSIANTCSNRTLSRNPHHRRFLPVHGSRCRFSPDFRSLRSTRIPKPRAWHHPPYRKPSCTQILRHACRARHKQGWHHGEQVRLSEAQLGARALPAEPVWLSGVKPHGCNAPDRRFIFPSPFSRVWTIPHAVITRLSLGGTFRLKLTPDSRVTNEGLQTVHTCSGDSEPPA
jgi:hypothetical protein